MTRNTLAAALSLVFAATAWAQSPPNGTYQFTSGPGSGYGTPPFQVSNFGSTISGIPNTTGFVGSHALGCAGLHVHGQFNNLADPAAGNCGHGTVGIFSIPGAGSLLPGSIPNSAAGTFALTRSAPVSAFNITDTGFIAGFTLIEGGCDTDLDCTSAPMDRSWPNVMVQVLDLDGLRNTASARIERMHISGTGGPDPSATLGASPPTPAGTKPVDQLGTSAEEWNRRQNEIAQEDMNIMYYGTPNPSAEQLAKGPDLSFMQGLRDGPPKPPPAAAANPPAQGAKPQPVAPEPPRESILDEIGEPTLGEMFGGTAPGSKPPAPKPAAAEAPDPEREKFLNKAAQDIADALFSGNADKGKAAATTLGNAPKDLQNRVVRQINERIQKIVNDAMRAATNAAAGAPRALN